LKKELAIVLKDNILCNSFREFLKANHSVENLYFWIEVELYKSPEETPNDFLQERASDIYGKYFISNAEDELNIDSDYKVRLNTIITI
jgi:hypothetical protein